MTTTDKTFAQVAISQFADTGEVTGLLALADWYEENEQQPELSALIRGVVNWDTVHWFYLNGASSYHPLKETQGEGYLRVAIRLVQAEEWFEGQVEDGDGYAEWELDDEGPDEEGNTQWGCVLVATVDHERGREDDTSLWGITFGGDGYPDGDPYSRVVVAELALELMPDAE